MSAMAARQRERAERIAVLNGLPSIWNYLVLKRDRNQVFSRKDRLIPLHARAVPESPLYCRPGTTDVKVFDDTFVGQYHLPPADLQIQSILDLGSNAGFTMAHYASIYPAAKILGIELDQGNAKLCARNTEPFGSRCRVIHGAVWRTDGEVGSAGDSEWGFPVTQDSPVTRRIPAYSMASLIDMLGTATVDFVKMDVEGAEEEILRDASPWRSRVRCLKVEVHEPYTLERCMTDLRRAGYQCGPDDRHPSAVLAVAS